MPAVKQRLPSPFTYLLAFAESGLALRCTVKFIGITAFRYLQHPRMFLLPSSGKNVDSVKNNRFTNIALSAKDSTKSRLIHTLIFCCIVTVTSHEELPSIIPDSFGSIIVHTPNPLTAGSAETAIICTRVHQGEFAPPKPHVPWPRHNPDVLKQHGHKWHEPPEHPKLILEVASQ